MKALKIKALKIKAWKISLLCATAVVGVAPSAWAGTACDALAGLSIPNTNITGAGNVAGPISVSGAGGQGKVSMPFCRIEGVTHPTPRSTVKFEVWLPPNWNTRMKTTTTGGFLGGIPYARLAEDVALGYTVVGSNLGHDGGADPRWDTDPDALAAYGYAAHPSVNKAARAVIAAFYDKPPAYSYFEGCSGGGRQALMVAQRYPELFDGILAGAPSYAYPDAIMQILWQQRIHKPKSAADAPLIPASKLKMVSASVLAACDAKDGLKDSLVGDPRACDRDMKALRCKAGDGPDCLNDAQLAGLAEIYRGPHRSTGEPLFSAPLPGSEYLWNLATGDSGGYGAFFGDVVFEDVKWDWRTLDFDTGYDTVRNKINPLMGAPSPDLSAFKARGGKLLQYHGWHDSLVAPSASPNYYNSLIAFEKLKGSNNIDDAIAKLTPQQIAADAAKPQPVQDYFRLFMVPGMGHCSGGVAPNRFDHGANAAPSKRDAEHSAVMALERWVEQGIAPERIVATQYVDNDVSKGIARERPLCVYPKVARYSGKGDIDAAANFACAAPDAKNLVPTPADMVQVRSTLKLREMLGPKAEN